MSNLPIGANIDPQGGVNFRVWAPKRKQVSVEICHNGETKTQRYELNREPNGYFSSRVESAGAGDGYRFVLDNENSFPDPASRFQPVNAHLWSEVIDPHQYQWGDSSWTGVSKNDLIIYELHVGTFTADGTYASAAERLPELVELGVTAVELLPLADTPGKWNWGYDGVHLFAPRKSYGRPDDCRAFVDKCHELGLAALLDVVYNHLGPEGNYLSQYGPYFTRRHHTPWGETFDYDGKHSSGVRELIIANAVHWIEEYHFDGLRLDAIHFMFDKGDPHVVAELRDAVQAVGKEQGRTVHLIGESNVYDPELIKPREDGGAGFDAIWCDDIMHAGYSIADPDLRLCCREYQGGDDLHHALMRGWLHIGPPDRRAERNPTDRADLSSLIVGVQNHDTVGNHPHGHGVGVWAANDFQRSLAALTMLYPSIPQLFMGEEFGSPAPFHFFVDFDDQHLQQSIASSRAAEHPQHTWKDAVSPIEPIAFEQSKIGEQASGDAQTLAWYRELIATRKRWIEAGLLNAENLSCLCSEENGLFMLMYRTETRMAFVWARLGRPGESAKPFPVKMASDWRMHSEGSEGTHLEMNQAIIGEGEIMQIEM